MQSRMFGSTMCYNIYDNNVCETLPKTLFLGYNHNRNSVVYLLFEVDRIPSQAMIESAHLFLYENRGYIHRYDEKYQIYVTPTCDYLNPYFVNYCNLPEVLEKRVFYEQASCNHILKLDVTYLVGDWINGAFPNFGMILELPEYSSLQTFSGFSVPGAQPFLRVNYREPEGKILYCFDSEMNLPSRVEKIDNR